MTEKPFDWDLFDAQPRAVKAVTWDHNIFPDRLVWPRDAELAAKVMRAHVEKERADDPATSVRR